jgi:tetratricopeptide (TPR) repeat protein
VRPPSAANLLGARGPEPAAPAAGFSEAGPFTARVPGVTQRFDLGVHYFLRREYREAVRYFQEAVREEPADAAAWSYYGIALAHLGRAGEAEAALARAIALSPENPEAWFHLGVARSLREEWPEAASAYRHTVALTPDDMVAWHRLGVALAESGDEVAASAAFERALVLSREVAPGAAGPPPASRIRDDHLAETGEREGAREAKSWLDLALSLLSLGDEEEAVAAYERAYTLDPERAQHSLFRPMLRLLTAVQGGPEPEETPVPLAPEPAVPERPRPNYRRPEVG